VNPARRPLMPTVALAVVYLVAGLTVLALLWPGRPRLDQPILRTSATTVEAIR
jgi:uncharacterized membrane protein YhhN